MKIEKVKNSIDSQFIAAIHSDVGLDGFHPFRVIQALKSLIGIDIDNPSEKLILWGNQYLDNFVPLSKDFFMYSIKKTKETIVISDLGENILSKRYDDCIDELQNLCSVSDGNQIFEYLLEFSCIHNKLAIPFIWSALRTNIFLKNKYSYHLLLLSIKVLMKEEFNNDGLMSGFEILCISESIRFTALTRSDRINNQLDDFNINLNLLEDDHILDKIDVIGKGRIAILDYLDSLELKFITAEMILFLDACRMVLKDSSEENCHKVNSVLNNVIQRELYVRENW